MASLIERFKKFCEAEKHGKFLHYEIDRDDIHSCVFDAYISERTGNIILDSLGSQVIVLHKDGTWGFGVECDTK